MKKFTTFLLFFCLTLCFLGCKVKASYDENAENDLFKQEYDVVQVFNYGSKDIYITDDDIYLMAQVVYAESRSEPYAGKVAVASVILNRVKDPKFPKTISGVITQKSAFSCVQNGKITVVPDESSYKAVLDALKGNDPTEKAVFFYNPKIATSRWMKNVKKDNIRTIGNHVFFVSK